MYYKKIIDGTLTIEFTNDWLGYERIVIEGTEVSKKYSVMGIDHPFKAIESGEMHYYVLTTKVNSMMEVFVDLSKDGTLIQEDIAIRMGAKPKEDKNDSKLKGIALVREYDLDDGLVLLEEAIKFKPSDPEIYFYMACAHSVLEHAEDGFIALSKALDNNMQNVEVIETHEMLSYLRMHPKFEDFRKKYDKNIN